MSQIDAVQDGLAKDVWLYYDGYVLRPVIRRQIFGLLRRMFGKDIDLVERVCIIGSITTKQYHKFSDIDLNIEVNYNRFITRYGVKAKKYTYGEYAFMMDRLVPYLEGVPVNGTERTFSVHVYFGPFILSSDNIYCVYPVERWIKGMNFPPDGFDPDLVFLPVKLTSSRLGNAIMRLSRERDNEVVRAFLVALDEFFVDFREYRFMEASLGRGEFRAYKFSADWDTGNIAIKYLGRMAKPAKFL